MMFMEAYDLQIHRGVRFGAYRRWDFRGVILACFQLPILKPKVLQNPKGSSGAGLCLMPRKPEDT